MLSDTTFRVACLAEPTCWMYLGNQITILAANHHSVVELKHTRQKYSSRKSFQIMSVQLTFVSGPTRYQMMKNNNGFSRSCSSVSVQD